MNSYAKIIDDITKDLQKSTNLEEIFSSQLKENTEKLIEEMIIFSDEMKKIMI